MAVLFYSSLIILPNLFSVLSLTLDIYYPEYNEAEQHYQQYPYRSPHIQDPNQFQCACQRPCQCTYPSPSESVYYPSSVFRSAPKPIERPIIIPPSPSIFSPGANFRPEQFAPSTQIVQDKTEYRSEDFARSHTETKQTPVQLESTIVNETKHASTDFSSSHVQTGNSASEITTSGLTIQNTTNYKSENHSESHAETSGTQTAGHNVRRHSSEPYSSIYQSPIYYQRSQQPHQYRYIRSVVSSNSPIRQVYNTNNGVKMDSNRGTGSIFLRGRDPRSAMESSEIQNGNDVASHSSIITPENSSTSQINLNSIRNKRAPPSNPLAWGRGITKDNYTIITKQKNITTSLHNGTPGYTLNSTQYHIVVPSRKFVSNYSDSLDRKDNDESAKLNGNNGVTGQTNARELISNARSSGYGGSINYQNGYPIHLRYIRPRRPIINMPTSAIQAFYLG